MTDNGNASLSVTCSVEGCGKPAFKRGLCCAHNNRLQRYGDPLGRGQGFGKGQPFEAKTILGAILRELSEETGESLNALTIMSPQKDPYRLDTPVHHRNGQWLREQMEACGLFARPIHNRGIHYAIFSHGATRPLRPGASRSRFFLFRRDLRLFDQASYHQATLPGTNLKAGLLICRPSFLAASRMISCAMI